MKKTARAPANIAFIKYWGKADAVLRLPMNTSISMNLSGASTITTVEFSKDLKADRIEMRGETMRESEKSRISTHLDRIRRKTGTTMRARVVTQNNFPKGTGIASSASGFAALTVAACGALGQNRSERELTILARLGSGSACRSVPDGFVQWEKGETSGTSYAHSLFPASYWDLRDIICVVENVGKKVSSTAGMERAETSPLWKDRLQKLDARITRIKQALATKDFRLLGETIEEEANNMHAVMQTQDPPLLYRNAATKRIIEAVAGWREKGLEAYTTVDAGPNVHIICEGTTENEVVKQARKLTGVQTVIPNKVAAGTHEINENLF